MRNILVIGNGYDLAHHLKTAYSDLLDFIKAKQYEKCGDSVEIPDEIRIEMSNLVSENAFIHYFLSYEKTLHTWVDIENELRRVTYAIKEFFDNCPENLRDNSFMIIEKMTEYQRVVLEQMGFVFSLPPSFRSEWQVDSTYYSSQYGVQWDEIKLKLRKELDGLKRVLEIYLMYYMPIVSNTKIVLKKQLLDINPDYLITFNYTDTYTNYGIERDENVLHVHGELGTCRIVLGFDDNDESDLKLIDFKKYFQRIQYHLERVDGKVISMSNRLVWGYSRGNVIAHFYGMSLDKTDADVIKEIYINSDKVIVYYYVREDGNQSDYEKKVINLIDILGKKRFLNDLDRGIIQFKQIVDDI